MKTVTIGKDYVKIEDITAISRKEVNVGLNNDPAYEKMIQAGSDYILKVIVEKGGVYGVTTGFGDSCDKIVPLEHFYDLPVHLVRFHGCGMGEMFDPETTRAILAVRLTSLAQGNSGVSVDLLKSLWGLIDNDILPLIPQEGSVGASGDLTPLSYVAAALMGEDRNVIYKGKAMKSPEALAAAGQKKHRLLPKEGLAIMNGTAAMTAVACLAFERAAYLGRLTCRLTALTSMAIKGNAYHFDERLFKAKPHPGQTLAADNIRKDLGTKSDMSILPERIQDPYSVRCAPHIVGVLFDALPLFRNMIEIEINSANDNPVVDAESESIMHGGHFYGGHIAFAMDSLKNIVANLADLIDRQVQVLVDEKYNRGLSPNLTGAPEHSYNLGFKAVQIGVSAWAGEALKDTMPASVFSRSTECHNQDKVSMGTIAARDCIRVLDLTEQVASAALLATVQAIELRKDIDVPAAKETSACIRKISPFLGEDRALEEDLREVKRMIVNQGLEMDYGSEPN